MAETDNLQIPEIIVCGSNKEVRSQIAASIENLYKYFRLTNISTYNSAFGEFVSAAASANLLVIALDKHDSFVTYYRRLIKTASVLGVRNIYLVLMNTEIPEGHQSVFQGIQREFDDYLDSLTQSDCGQITGSTLLFLGTRADWYGGKNFSETLEDFEPAQPDLSPVFRLPVASTTETGEPFGTIVSGSIQTGDKVIILPSAVRTSVSALEYMDQAVGDAQYGRTVKLKFETSVSAIQGDMICSAGDPVEVADQFETTIIWLSKDPMMAGRHYDFRSTANVGDATITTLKYLVNVDLQEHVAANLLQSGEIGVCNISLSKRIPFEHCDIARETAQFTLIDKETSEIVGRGAIHFALRRASNVHWQALDVTRNSRAELKGQKPAILWFTGLSGSGKSAIANIVEKKLVSVGRHTYTLDGDNIRHGLNRDLGFTDVDRVENIRRIGEVSKLMADCGLICLVSFISPFRSERQIARELAEQGEFIEIHVDTPLEVAEERDVKGLYKKARAGEIKNFTGIDSPYEPPENPEIRVDTVANSAEEAAEIILKKLQSWGKIATR
jgi:bifunctional enzyme CysN/CysC